MSQLGAIVAENCEAEDSNIESSTIISFPLHHIIDNVSANDSNKSTSTRHLPSAISWATTLELWSKLKIGGCSSSTDLGSRMTQFEVLKPNSTRMSITSPDFVIFGNPETGEFDPVFGDSIRMSTRLSTYDRNTLVGSIAKPVEGDAAIDNIKKNIRDCLSMQLNQLTSGDSKSSLIPVFQTLMSFVSVRILDGARKALDSIKDSGLVDQLLIMECLVKAYPDFLKSSNDIQAPKDEKNSSLFEIEYGVLNSSQIREFLLYANSIGKIVGLQVVFIMCHQYKIIYLILILGNEICNRIIASIFIQSTRRENTSAN